MKASSSGARHTAAYFAEVTRVGDVPDRERHVWVALDRLVLRPVHLRVDEQLAVRSVGPDDVRIARPEARFTVKAA